LVRGNQISYQEKGRVEIDAAYVRKRLEEVTKDEDLSRFIL
jgi:ATP-dependent protease HslVU (ClpYQ) ATPase subunit